MTAWSDQELERIADAEELEIAGERADGSFRPWVPIWVVTDDGQVFVRTWQRRQTGWFGHVLRSHQARVRVPGLEIEVLVDDVGEGPGDLRARVDEAYRVKYDSYGRATVGRMVADAAAAATLRLTRA